MQDETAPETVLSIPGYPAEVRKKNNKKTSIFTSNKEVQMTILVAMLSSGFATILLIYMTCNIY